MTVPKHDNVSDEDALEEYLRPVSCRHTTTVQAYFLEFMEAIESLSVLLSPSVIALIFVAGLRDEIIKLMRIRPPLPEDIYILRNLAQEAERLYDVLTSRAAQLTHDQRFS